MRNALMKSVYMPHMYIYFIGIADILKKEMSVFKTFKLSANAYSVQLSLSWICFFFELLCMFSWKSFSSVLKNMFS